MITEALPTSYPPEPDFDFGPELPARVAKRCEELSECFRLTFFLSHNLITEDSEPDCIH